MKFMRSRPRSIPPKQTPKHTSEAYPLDKPSSGDTVFPDEPMAMGEKYGWKTVGKKSVGEKYMGESLWVKNLLGKIGVGGMLAFVSPLLRWWCFCCRGSSASFVTVQLVGERCSRPGQFQRAGSKLLPCSWSVTRSFWRRHRWPWGGTRQHRVLCPLLQQYVPCCRGCSPQRQWSLEFGSSLPCGLPEGGGTSVRYPPALLVQFVAQHPPKLCGGWPRECRLRATRQQFAGPGSQGRAQGARWVQRQTAPDLQADVTVGSSHTSNNMHTWSECFCNLRGNFGCPAFDPSFIAFRIVALPFWIVFLHSVFAHRSTSHACGFGSSGGLACVKYIKYSVKKSSPHWHYKF